MSIITLVEARGTYGGSRMPKGFRLNPPGAILGKDTWVLETPDDGIIDLGIKKGPSDIEKARDKAMKEIDKINGKVGEGMLQKHIIDYDLEDIGVESPDYFQGRGVSHSDWDEVFVGVGDSYNTALRDAASQLWDSGVESESDKADELDTEISKASKKIPKDIESGLSGSDLLYHAAIYVKLGDEQDESLPQGFDVVQDTKTKFDQKKGGLWIIRKDGKQVGYVSAKNHVDAEYFAREFVNKKYKSKTKQGENMDLATKTLVAVGEASGKALSDLKSLKGGEIVMFKVGSRYEGMMGAVAEVQADMKTLSVRIGKAVLIVPPSDLLQMDFSSNISK